MSWLGAPVRSNAKGNQKSEENETWILERSQPE